MKTAKTPALRSWLDLVPLSARAHRRQNRMTLFCIVLAVSLVATIFAMADMELRTQRRTAIRTRIRPVDCWQIVNFKVISPLS